MNSTMFNNYHLHTQVATPLLNFDDLKAVHSNRLLDYLMMALNLFVMTLNLFHIMVFLTVFAPVDFPFKKQFVAMHYSVLPKLGLGKVIFFINSILVTALLMSVIDWSKGVDTSNSIIITGYTLLCALLLQRESVNLASMGVKRALEIEQEIERSEMLRFIPPNKNIVKHFMRAHDTVLPSEWTGLQNISNDSPSLFVMNHSLYGMDMAPFIAGLYLKKDIVVRGLADHAHFALPHGKLFKACGAVDGTRANVDALMEAKENILVYPGGGQEVLKHSSVPKYSLMWKERLGFARMAIKHGYPLIPCACVGVEDMFDIVADIDLTSFRKGQYLPIVGPVGPHKLQKTYFIVGEPIQTKQYNGEWQNDVFARAVRDKCKVAIEKGLKTVLERQQNDPDRYLTNVIKNYFFGNQKKDTKMKDA